MFLQKKCNNQKEKVSHAWSVHQIRVLKKTVKEELEYTLPGISEEKPVDVTTLRSVIHSTAIVSARALGS